VQASPDIGAIVVALDDRVEGIPRLATEAGFPTYSETTEWLARLQRRRDETAAAFRALATATEESGVTGPVFVYWSGRTDGETYRQVLLLTPNVEAVFTTADELTEQLRRVGAPASTAAGLRVMVIGDSTGQAIAGALSQYRDPAGAASFDTAYWGALGCPWVRVEAVRGSGSDPWHTLECPQWDDELPGLLAEFAPEVVILVIGPTDLGEQRFPGSSEGHSAEDSEYVAFHVAEASAIAELLPASTKVLIATSPRISPGPFSSESMSTPARSAAANAALASLPATSDQFLILEFGAAVQQFEDEFGSARMDGVHVSADAVMQLLTDGMAQTILALAR
jgi:hypothetical protein